ncbi:uncharacterized protein BDR25DRAFT_314735 [Lindgomyces ingoldianus]|uniref:Uncharacterized protein n=1 Tax=Lindgomyces ingoldianus TaxID=673940 RepID=A0ACB6QSK0_9PLEO|nr:uncharacterized protein BDR25DRAFT_314735 [Lindgomyces ingoldianus]KAF2469963.1 hypothetical protein BDR25DRAFT_314735 [Lindgomyces ingoldianus]
MSHIPPPLGGGPSVQSFGSLSISEDELVAGGIATMSATEPNSFTLERQLYGNEILYMVEADIVYRSDIALLAQWEEAREQCWPGDFRTHERDEIQKFRTPQQLLESLDRMALQYNDHTTSRLIAQIQPCLRTLKSFSGLFITSLAIRSLDSSHPFETTLLWGLLHLVIKGAITSHDTLKATVDILRRIRQQLRLFTKSFELVTDVKPIRQELVDMFVALIHFWTEAARWLRSTPISPKNFQLLNERFKDTLRRLEESVSIVDKLTDTRTRRRDTSPDITSLYDDQDQSKAKFPCKAGLPSLNPYFRCRTEELMAMSQFFQNQTATDELRCFSIFGLGGVGKSALAHAFIGSCLTMQRYDAVFWVKAQKAADVRESFAEIARCLELPKGEEDDLVQNTKNWLRKTAKTWLCVFDNVDDMRMLCKQNFLPYRGDIVITTRYKEQALQAPGRQKRLELDVLSDEDALNVFNSLRLRYESYDPTPREANVDAESLKAELDTTKYLLKTLGGHALAIEQMAAYIAHEGLSLEEYLDEYEKQSRRMHRFEGFTKDLTQHHLATLWEMHFDALSKTIPGKAALQLLGLLSLLAPDSIPCKLFEVEDDVSLPDAHGGLCKDESEFEDARDLLVKLALIKKQGDRHNLNLSLHRLVQKAYDFSKYGKLSRQESFSTLATLLNAKFPKMGGTTSLYGHWQECSLWLPHCLSLAETFVRQKEVRQRLRSSPDLDEVLKNCAWYLLEISENSESLKLIAIAQDACLDKKGLLYSQLCNNAGCIHFEMNQNIPCWESFSACLRIREELLHPDHPDLANTYSNIANYHASVGELKEAMEMHLKSFEIGERDPETEPEYKGLSRLGIGRVHFLKREFEDAINQYEEARKLWASLGPGGAFMMAYYHFDIGNVQLARMDFQRAKKSFKAGAAIASDNPTRILLGSFLYKIAIVQFHRGKLSKALGPNLNRENIEKAIKIAEHHNLQGHVARTLRLKAAVIEKQVPLSSAKRKEAGDLKLRAEMLKTFLCENGEIGELPGDIPEDEAYDRLLVFGAVISEGLSLIYTSSSAS